MDAWKLNTGAGDQAFDRGDAAQRVVAWRSPSTYG